MTPSRILLFKKAPTKSSHIDADQQDQDDWETEDYIYRIDSVLILTVYRGSVCIGNPVVFVVATAETH